MKELICTRHFDHAGDFHFQRRLDEAVNLNRISRICVEIGSRLLGDEDAVEGACEQTDLPGKCLRITGVDTNDFSVTRCLHGSAYVGCKALDVGIIDNL